MALVRINPQNALADVIPEPSAELYSVRVIRRPRPIPMAGAALGTTFGVDLGFAVSASALALLKPSSPNLAIAKWNVLGCFGVTASHKKQCPQLALQSPSMSLRLPAFECFSAPCKAPPCLFLGFQNCRLLALLRSFGAIPAPQLALQSPSMSFLSVSSLLLTDVFASLWPVLLVLFTSSSLVCALTLANFFSRIVFPTASFVWLERGRTSAKTAQQPGTLGTFADSAMRANGPFLEIKPVAAHGSARAHHGRWPLRLLGLRVASAHRFVFLSFAFLLRDSTPDFGYDAGFLFFGYFGLRRRYPPYGITDAVPGKPRSTATVTHLVTHTILIRLHGYNLFVHTKSYQDHFREALVANYDSD